MSYLVEYLAFFARATVELARGHGTRRYQLVHVHTLPDFLVFATLPLKVRGVPVILDLHEAMPEFFGSRFHGVSGRLGRALVALQERASIRYANALITVNDALRDRLLRLGVPASKVTVVRNVPALARFDATVGATRTFMSDGALRLVYTGALSPIYELDVAIAAVAALARLRPGLAAQLDLYGRDFAEVPLAALADGLGVSDRVHFHGRIPIEAVPAALGAADIGLAPTRRSEFTDYSLSTKIFEYAAMRRPVIASRLPMVERTFGDDVVTYEPGDAEDLAHAVLRIVDVPAEREARVERALARVHADPWELEADRLVALVESLATG